MSAPKVDPVTSARMESLLLEHSDGLLGWEIAVALFGTSSESAKRKVRAIASQLKPTIISAPSCGYKHLNWASDEELCHARASFGNQAVKMMKNASLIGRALNARRMGQEVLNLAT
jgi:hypothetical protein